MNEFVFKVRAFGMLRDFADEGGFLQVSCGPGTTPAGFKRALMEQLANRHPAFDARQVLDCAIADEREVLSEDSAMDPGRTFAILPPVCGG